MSPTAFTNRVTIEYSSPVKALVSGSSPTTDEPYLFPDQSSSLYVYDADSWTDRVAMKFETGLFIFGHTVDLAIVQGEISNILVKVRERSK